MNTLIAGGCGYESERMATPCGHTKGPWTVCRSLYAGTMYRYHITGNQYGSVNYIAEWSEAASMLPTDEANANANLIAAAPAMLESLERQLAWLEHVKPQIAAVDSVILGFEQSIKYIGEVIKEAKEGV